MLYCNDGSFLQHENGEMLSPFSAAGATAIQVGRERMGETGSVSSTSSMSPLPSSPAQALGYRGREGSFEARYQSPLDDFRVSQEALLDHENRRYDPTRLSILKSQQSLVSTNIRHHLSKHTFNFKV